MLGLAPDTGRSTGRREGAVAVNDREQFMAYAASMMRSVVVDCVRRRQAERRGGDAEHVTLDTRAAESFGSSDDEILAVRAALHTLAKVDGRLKTVIETRCFAGLSDAEIAAAMGSSERTLRRDRDRARLLLAELPGRPRRCGSSCAGAAGGHAAIFTSAPRSANRIS